MYSKILTKILYKEKLNSGQSVVVNMVLVERISKKGL